MVELSQLRIEEAHTFEEVNAVLLRYGLTDGLPVVPPSPARVARMLGGRDPEHTVARLAPRNGEARLQELAMCAVMAGCRPEYFPLLVAAVEAVADPAFNLLGVSTTTGNAAVMAIVNGPAIARCGLNAEANALGPGNRANATLGRALALVLKNVGGAQPGLTDMATQGQPAKYGCCFAENEPAHPWEPLAVSRGMAPDRSAVTVVAAAGLVEVVDVESPTADGLLQTLAHSMTPAGTLGGSGYLGSGEPLLLLAPEHAALLAKSYGRREVQERLLAEARLPTANLTPGMAAFHRRAHGEGPPPDHVAVAARAEDILLVVVGGVGRKSAYVPTWGGGTRAVTRPVEE